MPIEDLPSRLRELGRLRMGEKAIGKNGKPYPVKRNTWRFTSQSAELLGVVSERYGGEVEDWPEAPGQGRFFQVKTEAKSIPVLIPVGNSLSQFYEFWSADGCTRRCTGKVNVIDESPCVCPSDISERMEAASGTKPTACKPTTRLNVMLPDVPDLGYWRLEAHGYQAAIELPGALAQYVGLAKVYAGPGADLDELILRAELMIEERSTKKPGQPPAHFVVPVIRTPQVTPSMLMTGEAPGLATVRQIGPGGAAAPELETGSQREDAARTSPPAPPPFDESNERYVTKDQARKFKDACKANGLDYGELVLEATNKRTYLPETVYVEEWDTLKAVFVEAQVAKNAAAS